MYLWYNAHCTRNIVTTQLQYSLVKKNAIFLVPWYNFSLQCYRIESNRMQPHRIRYRMIVTVLPIVITARESKYDLKGYSRPHLRVTSKSFKNVQYLQTTRLSRHSRGTSRGHPPVNKDKRKLIRTANSRIKVRIVAPALVRWSSVLIGARSHTYVNACTASRRAGYL